MGPMAIGLWDWLGEPLAMDFANTTRRRGMVEHDYLRDGSDLESWSEREAGRVPRVTARAAAARFDEVLATRDDVKAVLRATVDGTPLPAAAVGRLNARVRALPIVPQLGPRPGELRTAPAARASALDELLARVAAHAIEIAGSGDPDAIHFCDPPSCGDFFAPDRPNQRWCDTSCGTRARVARHAAHLRGEG
jgi:predicted RNA-binding Zn ribbon-like protein